MLVIPASISLADIMRYVWNVLIFSLMLFSSDILLLSRLFCSFVKKFVLLCDF